MLHWLPLCILSTAGVGNHRHFTKFHQSDAVYPLPRWAPSTTIISLILVARDVPLSSRELQGPSGVVADRRPPPAAEK
jgi:hypothetical protein